MGTQERLAQSDQPKIKLLLDSGAFSAWKRGVEIDIDEYISYIKEHQHLLYSYVSLDHIPGVFGVARSREQIAHSAEKSYQNQQYMKSKGLEPIPVFHMGEDFKWLCRYMADGEPYIGISPAADLPQGQIRDWLDRAFTIVCDEDGIPKVKTHGFGVASFALLKRYPWYCMTDEHEILTRHGWAGRKQIKVGDEVLCFNDGEARWEIVQDVPVFDVTRAPIHQFDYQTFSARVTPNHRWRVKYKDEWKWVTTEDLNFDHRVPRAPDNYCAPKKTISDDLVELMAWFWTEGNIRKRPGYKKNSVAIYQSNSANPEKVERIRVLLKRLKEKFCENVDRRPSEGGKPSEVVMFELYGTARDWLLTNAPDKHLTWDFLWTLTESQIKLLVDVSILADGWRDLNKPAHRFLSQALPQSIEVFRAACLIAGHPTSQTLWTDAKGRETHTVSLSPVRWCYPINYRGTHDVVPFTGKVWCVHVPSHAFFTRCNGKIYVTGNTADATSWALTAAYGSIYVPVYKGKIPDYNQPPVKLTVSEVERKSSDLPSDHYLRYGPIMKERVVHFLTHEVGVKVEDAAVDYEVRARAIVYFMLRFQEAIGEQPFRHFVREL